MSAPRRLRIARRAGLRLLAGCLLFMHGLPALAAHRVEINAPQPLKDLLEEFLDVARHRARMDLNADQMNVMIARTPEQVARLAATEGYFSTETEVEVDREDGTTLIRVSVDAGPRTAVSDVAIEVNGAARAQSPEQVGELRQAWPLTPGEPFRQEDWSAAKQSGLQALRRRHYAAAEIADSEARIYADEHEAELSVTYDSGPAFSFGEPVVSGTERYPERIVRNVNPIPPGEAYSAERLLEYQRQILRTPYYSNATVEIDRDPANARHAPIRVGVTEFPQQQVRAGLGFTTDTGARVDSSYSHLDVFGRAWVFDTRLAIERRRQLGEVALAMPPGRNAFVNSVHGSLERTTLEGVELQSRRVGVRRTRNTDKRDVAYTLEYYNDELEQISGAALPPDTVIAPGSHQALVAGIARTRRMLDNPLFPRDGRIVTLQAGVAVKGLLTDQTFLRLYGQLREYFPVKKRDLVILRAELGAVISKGGNAAIPASLLFRAGGTESVRGYGFQSIGNVSDGTVYPTRFLVTGGVEYQHWFLERWGAAVFYDIGTATDRWNGKEFFQGVGIGARWRSPVGRINADLAYGLRDGKIRPHLSLGVAF